MNRPCQHCQTLFAPRKRAQRFCSKRCAAAATYGPARRIQARACAGCGAEFTPHFGRGRYCSRACSGKANVARRAVRPAAERFWSHVEKSDGCWLWAGAVNNKGYGLLGLVGRKLTLAHRFSYELANGPLPAGACVLHRCDVPRCVRPDHLFVGTRKDNADDCASKGRRRTKTADDEVRKARALFAEGMAATVIAAALDVHPTTVWRYVSGRCRRHVV